MFAGARLRFQGSLAVDEPLERRGRVARVETKSGSAGELVIATLHLEVSGATGAITEEQDLIFLVDQPAPRAVAADDPSPDGWPWTAEVAVDPTLLFRFSALTYNAHRIHYDHEYATGIEGYPGLVVHGPLQAMAMVDLARRHEPARTITDLTFRTLRPAFDGGPLLVRGRPDGATAELATFTHDGRQSSRMTLRWT
jgi:3-methylfumaryl-CoA hydratase